MKVENISQIFERLEEIGNSSEISDFVISQLNPYSSVEELDSIAKELNYGEGIKFYNSSANGYGENIQFKIINSFINKFFYNLKYVSKEKDKDFDINLCDFNEFFREESPMQDNKDTIYFSMQEIKIINDNNKNKFSAEIKEINKNLKLSIYEELGKRPIIVHGNQTRHGFIDDQGIISKIGFLLFNSINSDFLANSYYKDAKHKIYMTNSNKRLNNKLLGYSSTPIMRYIYGLGDFSDIRYDKNKLESINQGTYIILGEKEKNKSLDISKNPNALIDQCLYERGWILPLSYKVLLNPKFYFGEKPNLTDDIRLEILDYCRLHKERLSYEPTLKQSMEQLIQKMFEIKRNNL